MIECFSSTGSPSYPGSKAIKQVVLLFLKLLL